MMMIMIMMIIMKIIRRYRKKLLENSDSTTFQRNSLDLSPSFQHKEGEDNSLNKIYSLVKMKAG